VQAERVNRASIQLDLYQWYLIKAQLDALEEKDPARAALEDELKKAGANTYAHVIAYGISAMYEGGTKRLRNSVPDYTQEPSVWVRS